jgi:hypothetical protein
MKGSRPGKLPAPSPVVDETRACSEPGCGTRLSIYNLTQKCWQHADLRFPNYRGKRLAEPRT